MVAKKGIHAGSGYKERGVRTVKEKEMDMSREMREELAGIKEELRGIKEGVAELVRVCRNWRKEEETVKKREEQRRGEWREEEVVSRKKGDKDRERDGEEDWWDVVIRDEEREKEAVNGKESEEEQWSKKIVSRENCKEREKKRTERQDKREEKRKESRELGEISSSEGEEPAGEERGERRKRAKEEEVQSGSKKAEKVIVRTGKTNRDPGKKTRQTKGEIKQTSEERREEGDTDTRTELEKIERRGEGETRREEGGEIRKGSSVRREETDSGWRRQEPKRARKEEQTGGRKIGEEEAEREDRTSRWIKEREEYSRKKRESRIVWRGVEGESGEFRRDCLRVIIKSELGREVEIRGIEERKGDKGGWVIIMELGEVEDREEILARRGEIWNVGVDEDLSIEERKMRWRILEAARRERAKGKRVGYSSRELWVEERKWEWDETAHGYPYDIRKTSLTDIEDIHRTSVLRPLDILWTSMGYWFMKLVDMLYP
ncbi:trichohyalin-like [Monomorium pharaonis]|uniref:trichohyalin-like n=1 Tax=Monomorium pharaonis TaxID=307658 RepID=UPI00174664B3|nr:trichohyalin-like [Monomorium pharaonis]